MHDVSVYHPWVGPRSQADPHADRAEHPGIGERLRPRSRSLSAPEQ